MQLICNTDENEFEQEQKFIYSRIQNNEYGWDVYTSCVGENQQREQFVVLEKSEGPMNTCVRFERLPIFPMWTRSLNSVLCKTAQSVGCIVP